MTLHVPALPGFQPGPSLRSLLAMSPDPAQLDHDHLWHPFTQQLTWCEEEPLMIEDAQGSHLIATDGRRYIDGVSSLWCNVHGHRHPGIDRALRDQLDRVAHTTMLGLSHPGAAELAGRLVELAPPGLSRVFYSDSGSTATEIALKMAFQYQRQRGGQHVRRTSFVHLRDAYHGDTIGSVSVGGIDLFHATYRPLLFKTHAAEPGDAGDLERILALREEEIAAVIVEPLVQGAAGMLVQPPGYLRAVRELCDAFGVLLICDEVATGFGRTGTMFACEQEEVAPDFLCLAKGLTGGYMPLAATLATERVYEGFLGAPRSSAPSSTATPTPATRSPAPPRSPASTPSSRSRPWRACNRRSACSASCWARSDRWPRWPRCAAAASWSASTSASTTPPSASATG